jgi:hypothetical protein
MATHGFQHMASRPPSFKSFLLEWISHITLLILGLGVIGMEIVTVFKMIRWYWIH